MFPCFDEPSFKATFEIVVGHSSDRTSMSVTPLMHSEQDESRCGWILDYFAPTPPIAPFSVGIMVSDHMETVSEIVKTSQGEFVLQRYHGSIDYLMETVEASQMVANMLKNIMEFFGVAYPLPRLNMGFSLNLNGVAMTNSLGLLMLCDLEWSRLVENGEVLANVWLHHMITPEMWSEFEIISYLSVFVAKIANMKMKSSEPLYTQRCYVKEEEGLYSERGFWFFWMLICTLSQKTFQRALKNLLSHNMYGTYTNSMLWDAMTEAAHVDGTLSESVTVENIANSWFREGDYDFPVLTVCRNYSENSALLQQDVFLKEKTDKLTEEEEKRVWWLPIMNLTQGMFLVNYDTRNWELISRFLNTSSSLIPAITRKKLLQDVFLLNSAGQLNHSTALNMTLFLLNESIDTVWKPFFDWIKPLIEKCERTSIEDKLKLYVRHLMQSVKDTSTCNEVAYGWTYPDMYEECDDKNLKDRVTEVLQKIGNQEIVDENHNKVKSKMSTFTLYDEDSQLMLFYPEFVKNEVADWSEKSENSKNLQEFLQCRGYLSNYRLDKFPDYAGFMQKILVRMLDETRTFQLYDWQSFIYFLSSSPGMHRVFFNFFLEHFKELRRRFFFFKEMWETLFSSAVTDISTEDDFKELLKFREEHKDNLGYSLKILDDAVENATKTIEWIRNDLPEIKDWLDEIVSQLKKSQQEGVGDKLHHAKLQPVFFT